MRFAIARRRERVAAAILGWSAGLAGCASPPSAAPLMRAAMKAVAQEQQLLAEDGRSRQQWLEAQKTGLQRGFESDLRARTVIEPDWVLEGTAAYVTAREQLIRQEMTAQAALEVRQQNLLMAQRAVERAISLMERQDALLEWMPDARRLLEQQENKP